ncbi:MAG: LemA family protein [Cyclobacteriaceae bacterium]
MKLPLYITLFMGILWISCSNPNQRVGHDFTRADSLTEHYLTLQDSILHAWNVMIRDEKEKIKNMHELIRLMEKSGSELAELKSLEQRIQQLEKIRFTQKSLSNPYVIDEYDFASGSIIAELISMAEVDPATINNPKIQKLVDQIKAAEQRVSMYRTEYDRVVADFNAFLEDHGSSLDEIDAEVDSHKKPLFQVASEKD